MMMTARRECFRSYATAADSYRDHSDFLRQGSRYAFLFKLDPTDYEGWAYGLKKAGYATNIRYSQILIKLIKDYNLQQYTLIAIGKMAATEEVVLGGAVAAVGHRRRRWRRPDTAAAGSGMGDGRDSGKSDAAIAGPEVSYPEGEFLINRTRVVYVQAGVSLLSIANQYEYSAGAVAGVQ